MVIKLILDEAKYMLFMEDFNGWHSSIKAHANKIEKMLASVENIVLDKNKIDIKAEITLDNSCFLRQLYHQHQQIAQLELANEAQQTPISKICETKTKNDFEIISPQNILRKRIKAIEKHILN